MSGPVPFLSVIVPAYQGGSVLPVTLEALVRSDLPRERWELIVVNDASTDATAAVAAGYADRVVTLEGRPHGPGYARNRGANESRGEWLVFIDADVRVHPDTLRRFQEAVTADPPVDAVFGAYDDAPVAGNFLSQYRNLLHRYVHLEGAGETDTFWAGCGAMRRTAFVAAGGFDEARYPRPQIEDIELGYRLWDRGGRILILPQLQGTHLKRWSFFGSLRTDLFDRGIPWVLLLLERGNLARHATLNFKIGERLKAAAVALALVLGLGSALTGRPLLLLASAALLLGVVIANRRLLRWFAAVRGGFFAVAVVPFNLLYYVLSGLSVAAGLVLHLLRGPADAAISKEVIR